jgi:hypothetical protein
MRWQEQRKSRKQCADVGLVLPVVYDLDAAGRARDIDPAFGANSDRDVLAPRSQARSCRGSDLPGIRLRFSDVEPGLPYCLQACLKDLIPGLGKDHAALVVCGHVPSDATRALAFRHERQEDTSIMPPAVWPRH